MITNGSGKGGYGRPPSDSRFKPGHSGNPSGRPKGARNLRSDFTKVLQKRVRIRENGEPRYVSRQEAILLNLCAQALHGDTKASGQLLAMWAKMQFQDAPPSQLKVTPDIDRAIVEEFVRRNKEAASSAAESSPAEDETAVDPSNNDDPD